MLYYVQEIRENDKDNKLGGTKARLDAERIFEKKGAKKLNITITDRKGQSIIKKIKGHIDAKNKWNKMFSELKSGDVVILQYMFFEHSIFLYQAIKKARKENKKIIMIIHDLESLQRVTAKTTPLGERLRIGIEEKSIHYADKIIVHNNKMKKIMLKMGYKEEQLVVLEIFDYLLDNRDEERLNKRVLKRTEPVIISGNLRKNKTEFAYKLPEDIEFNLYGIDYDAEPKENIHYHGSFLPDEVPYVMNGSFGLVWDGQSIETCSGRFGEYLRINNPHKTSLYLMAGIPVAIWKNAALADFINKYHCGVTIESISDIKNVVENMTDEQYEELKKNTEKIGKKLLDGYFMDHAIDKCLDQLNSERQ